MLTYLGFAVLLLNGCGDSSGHVTAGPGIPTSLQSFDGFAVGWLGDAYDVDSDGKEEDVSSAKLSVSPAIVDPETKRVLLPELLSYTVSYGECELPPPDPETGEQSCVVPLTMVFYEPCSWKALLPIDDGKPRSVRGVDAVVRSSGIVRLYTADFMVVIAAPGKDEEERAENGVRIAGDLRGANDKAAHITPSNDFRPAAACSVPAPELPTPPGGALESNSYPFSVDVDALVTGVQVGRTIAVGMIFNVEVGVSAGTSWEGYHITLHYDDAILDGVMPNPDQPWTVTPIEGVQGGNRLVFTTTPPLCTPSTQGTSIYGEDDAGDAYWAMTCTEGASGTNHTGDGALVQFTFKCEAAGTANLTLTGIDDTFLLDSSFTKHNDSQQNATITCQ